MSTLPALVVPENVASWTPAQKIALYASKRAMGYSDAEIRAAVEAALGRQADSDWAYLQTQAGFGPAAGGGGGTGLLIAAAAAFFLLG